MASATSLNPKPPYFEHRKRKHSDDDGGGGKYQSYRSQLKVDDLLGPLKALTPEEALEKLKINLEELKKPCKDKPNINQVAQLVDLVKSTHGITKDNYLAYDDRFHAGGTDYIDGITAKDLGDRAVVWTVDPRDRLAISFQYIMSCQTYSKTTRESLTIFQRHPDEASLVPGGHCKSLNMDNITTDFEGAFAKLTRLLKGNQLNQELRIFEKGPDGEFVPTEITLSFHVPNRDEMLALEATDKR